MHLGSLPEKQGLYDPANEHDACGVGFVAHIKGEKSHDIVEQGLTILKRIVHRGAVGADPKAGDGAGLLMQIPDTYFREVVDFELPALGDYGVGMLFLPKDATERQALEATVNKVVESEGQIVLGWRDVPVDSSDLGDSVKPTEPSIRQIFIGRGDNIADQNGLERKLFVIHKMLGSQISKAAEAGYRDFYINSMSTRTIVYKGMLLAEQVGEYYLDLLDKRTTSAIVLVHQRFSTNTFPTWDLAHPFRMMAHNGEINTNRGNVNWMAARKHSMQSDILGDDLKKIWPVIPEGQSDTACLDNALELLVAGGYSLVQAMTMLIPEAWAHSSNRMDAKRRAYYEYNAALMEPWDGPAAVAFTDGRQVGAMLDRNGLRPARYLITDDNLVVMASEMGVLDIPEDKIVKKWRLEPGKTFLIDTEEGRIISDEEVKTALANAHPYQDWLEKGQIELEDLTTDANPPASLAKADLLKTQQAFGYTQEYVKFLLDPMVNNGEEGLASMGTDTPVAVLSDRSRHLSNYFKQNFAQVTNPPIDPIREEVVMSLVTLIGPRPNLLGHDDQGSHMRLESSQPVLSNEDLDRIRHIHDHVGNAFQTATLDITYYASKGAEGMREAIYDLCAAAKQAVLGHYNILILSDRAVSAQRLSIPALLATSAVHQYLIQEGLRTETGLVVETGAALEIHHIATLAGYGAEAVNPWLALETITDNLDDIAPGMTVESAHKNYVKAVGKGLKKVMSKMGISTYQSYCGAQIFDAIGLSTAFLDEFFTGTQTTVEGMELDGVAKEAAILHDQGFGNRMRFAKHLDIGGDYAYRTKGEAHVWTPDTISKLQHAVRGNDPKTFKEFCKLVDEQSEKLLTLRGLMKFNLDKASVPLDEVESATEIVKRFATGAMSFGSISHEAHSTLAIAMNEIGGKSNTGEGGEEPSRYLPLADGKMNPMRSAIKQVASGRFGVTAEYLVNSDMIQIKMAQGAKPGEGGQLPGHKVDERIAKVRHSTEGVGLISPPPHHDIYSIEDLAQLIHDLKNVNPIADISVKLVSEIGVGTVAAGVSKAHADHLTISGFEGGTGASPITSIKHAGSPWELGLAETHQTLVLNKLRNRICVQADGGLRTGRDVIIAALLGADEFGFATAPLIAEGCIMMRKCHLNTCPVGVATQDPELRKRFTGKPEHVINYFFYVAEEIREIMAELGYRNFNDMIGQSDRLDMKTAVEHWKTQGLDYSRLLAKPEADSPEDIYWTEKQDHGLDAALDNELIKQAAPALENGDKVEINIELQNHNRTFGTMLSGRVAEKYGHAGLPDDTIMIRATGTAGQSFGAWLAKGVTAELFGTGNDYVGKGLSGGRIVIAPPKNSKMGRADQNIISGNTLLYGAISGEAYLSGVVGERFAVRNSGASAVVEGVGDHGCEYMTGGTVVCLGGTGRNFAAGMSGGIAYVLDLKGEFASNCNTQMVELETVDTDEGDEDISDPMMADEQRLKQLIVNHYEYTGSQLAEEILADWEGYLTKFVKVTPTDYRHALKVLKKRRAAA
ncbi:glutamate synthase large subunit [Leucothrix arctica]|uniref:Glutamate synthase [NADPH] large chain n=1 Tax=Leucothrix arctica TaxID=1481894 RepID=A0A317CCT5_9GAMM|nr:glutamate synthase large subunit [Leucothrix arctica]PWQ94120.1 glutamate synthase large subunit [Leucothrix arctica]